MSHRDVRIFYSSGTKTKTRPLSTHAPVRQRHAHDEFKGTTERLNCHHNSRTVSTAEGRDDTSNSIDTSNSTRTAGNWLIVSASEATTLWWLELTANEL